MKSMITMLFLMLLGAVQSWGQSNSVSNDIRLWVWRPTPTHAPMILPRIGNESAAQSVKRYNTAREADPTLKSIFKKLNLPKGEIEELVLSRPSVLILANDKDDMSEDPKRFHRFADPIADSGASSFLLPMVSDLGLNDLQMRAYQNQLLANFQGVVAVGGDDLDPALIHQGNRHSVGFNTLRDVSEMKVVKSFLKAADKIVIGVCRGHQMVLSLLDARYRLVQDIEIELGLPSHRNTFHYVQTLDPKLTASIYPLTNENKVNSQHHQGFINLPEDGPVKVTATDENGIVEATEFKNGRGFTFQFHPELMSKAVSSEFGRLIAGLVLRSATFDKRTKSTLARDLTRVRCESAAL